jgi:hypothetical protein
MKKTTPFKEREPMSQYETHTTFFQYTMLAIALYAVIMFTFMTRAIEKLAG